MPRKKYRRKSRKKSRRKSRRKSRFFLMRTTPIATKIARDEYNRYMYTKMSGNPNYALVHGGPIRVPLYRSPQTPTTDEANKYWYGKIRYSSPRRRASRRTSSHHPLKKLGPPLRIKFKMTRKKSKRKRKKK